jgi:hypothetical protein
MSNAISADKFVKQWAEALCLDPLGEHKVRRLVIDAEVGNAVQIYVERCGTDRLLEIVPPGRAEVEIKDLS